jgi:uncharacterized protein (DUF58 family)
MREAREILKKMRRLEIRTRHIVEAAFAGQYRSVFKGSGMNFEEVREYQAGDEVRSIDWNVTARFGHPFIKKFAEERELTVMLVVDLSASGLFGGISASKRELAAEASCLLAFSAVQNNDKVGLILFTDRVELFLPPRKGRQHALRLIREVLFFQPAGRGTDAAAALRDLNRMVPRRAVVFLVSDFLSRDFRRELSATARRHDVIAVSVSDPHEEDLPDVGRVAFEDAETGEVIEVNTGDHSVRAAYRGLAERRRESMERLFARERVDRIDLRTDRDYLPPLRDFFRERARRLSAE